MDLWGMAVPDFALRTAPPGHEHWNDCVESETF